MNQISNKFLSRVPSRWEYSMAVALIPGAKGENIQWLKSLIDSYEEHSPMIQPERVEILFSHSFPSISL